jgi:hypothetical protein
MEENATEYQFGTIEDILRECEAEPAEPDRQTEMGGGILLTGGVHVYLPRHEINVHEGFFCHMENGQLEPLYFLTAIYDREDKEVLYDAEENFVDTVHQWLKGKCTLEQLEQEPCEVKGIREDIVYGKSIQTGGRGRNPCRDGTACGSPGRHHGKR